MKTDSHEEQRKKEEKKTAWCRERDRDPSDARVTRQSKAETYKQDRKRDPEDSTDRQTDRQGIRGKR